MSKLLIRKKVVEFLKKLPEDRKKAIRKLINSFDSVSLTFDKESNNERAL